MPSSRRAQKDGAIVAYDEEQANKPRPKKKKPRPPENEPNSRSDTPRRRPREADDNVSAISDAEYEPDPDDEPQFKYSTAELADNSCRNSTCCIVSMVVLCLIVIIVLSFVMVRVFQDQDEENKAAPPTYAPTTLEEKDKPGISLFRSPQSVIEEERCSRGDANSNACQTACEDFDCCDPTLPQDESCFYHNQEGCLNYQRCHVTSSGVGVPPPQLEQLCTPQNVAANRAECENACSSVSCCWKADLTCYDKFYTCLDYSPCLNLRSNFIVPAATFQVNEFCDPNKAGSLSQTTACEDACRPAECCWSEDPNENCLKSEFLACMSYAQCGKLDIPGAGNQTALPPASIRNDCSVTKLNTGDTATCEESCSNGDCCFQSGTSDCFLDDPLACLSYEPCQALDG